MLTADQKELIALEVIKTLHLRFKNFPDDASKNRNAPFHEAFLKAFKERLDKKISSDIPYLVSLASWLHGLNTSLGQSFFEEVSHILSDGSKKKFKKLKISAPQQTAVSDIIAELSNGECLPNCERENGLIFPTDSRHSKAIPNFSVDCFYEDNDSIVAIELKTVKPNKGIFKGEKDKILCAKAALKNAYPDKKVSYYLGFPFDPLSKDPIGYDKISFLNYSVDFKRYFEQSEILLASELWDFLSGETDTMNQLLRIINSIATPQFMDNLEFLKHSGNRRIPGYSNLLVEWNLHSEKYILEHEERVFDLIKKQKKLARVYHQDVFNSKGEYNSRRFLQLKEALR